VLFSCQEKSDFSAEMDSIIKVIEGESDAYRTKDFQKFADHYLQDETTIWWGSGHNTYWRIDGWEKLGSNFEMEFEKNPEPLKYNFEKSNYRIKVYPDCAWATFDEVMKNEKGDVMWEGFGVRFLEKVEREWKINYASTYEYFSSEDLTEEFEEKDKVN
jgi:ketosteroid isomerase-like protein